MFWPRSVPPTAQKRCRQIMLIFRRSSIVSHIGSCMRSSMFDLGAYAISPQRQRSSKSTAAARKNQKKSPTHELWAFCDFILLLTKYTHKWHAITRAYLYVLRKFSGYRNVFRHSIPAVYIWRAYICMWYVICYIFGLVCENLLDWHWHCKCETWAHIDWKFLHN